MAIEAAYDIKLEYIHLKLLVVAGVHATCDNGIIKCHLITKFTGCP